MNSHVRQIGVVLCLLILLPAISHARTWYIKEDGSGDVPTIQAGVDSAAPGDTVLLASGVFTGDGNINVVVTPKAFLMTSETGDPGDCIIDCEGHLGPTRRGFEFQETALRPVIYGITVRNGNAGYSGGAAYCEGSPTFRNCVFESNYSSCFGGAVTCFWTGYPAFKECIFKLNEAGMYGGAIAIDGVFLWVTVDSCTFYGNEAVHGGAICCFQHEADANIRNSVFVENSALDVGGAIAVLRMGAQIDDCTFFSNSAPTGSGIYSNIISVFALAGVRRCIIAYGVGGMGYAQREYYTENRSLRCTDIYGNEGGDWVGGLEERLGVDGNFWAEPAFCNPIAEPYDLSLCDCSPCLPGNHPDGYDCGLVGALGEGCACASSSTRPTTWGGIKALFR